MLNLFIIYVYDICVCRYLDGALIFGISGQSLQKLTGSLIPVEPMYMVLNTAISHRWGMPGKHIILHSMTYYCTLYLVYCNILFNSYICIYLLPLQSRVISRAVPCVGDATTAPIRSANAPYRRE